MKNTLGDIHRCYVRKGFHGEVWEMLGKNKGNLIKPLRAPLRALTYVHWESLQETIGKITQTLGTTHLSPELFKSVPRNPL